MVEEVGRPQEGRKPTSFTLTTNDENHNPNLNDNEDENTMTIKTYKSSSVLSFSITMPSGVYRRIRFTPFSWGGGVYITSDMEEQEILESRPEFGTRYRLDSVEEKAVVVSGTIGSFEEPKKAVEKPEQVEKPAETEEPKEEANVESVSVADFAEAKEYLMEHFGYKSGQLRSQKAIAEAAEKNGIVFDYA